jgi:hypothetical protein
MVPVVERFLLKVHPPPIPLKTKLQVREEFPKSIVLPVVVELKVIVPVELHTVPTINEADPRTLSVGVVPVAKVTVPAETVISKQANAPVMVTV